jgi:hypothetical protein
MGARIALAVVTEIYAFTIERNSHAEGVGANSVRAALDQNTATDNRLYRELSRHLLRLTQSCNLGKPLKTSLRAERNQLSTF